MLGEGKPIQVLGIIKEQPLENKQQRIQATLSGKGGHKGVTRRVKNFNYEGIGRDDESIV